MATKITDETISAVMREMGRRGGSVTGVAKGTAALDPEERKRRASQAAKAMWAKKRAETKGKRKAGK